MSEGSAKAVMLFGCQRGQRHGLLDGAEDEPGLPRHGHHPGGWRWCGAEQLHIAHVGDSRIYLVTTRGELEQLTRDHTAGADADGPAASSAEEEAEHHPKKHYITRAIGVGGHCGHRLSDV